MKINTSDKAIAWLTLLSGLSISAVAVWYSVAGLVSIFAAAAVPIMIMGVALELSKLVATVWLKFNWSIAPRLIKTYLIIAITILMMITSMGIFGFLSKAHLDQAVPTGDVADKVALLDEKIKTQKENIDAARKALKQMDESVDQVMARSTDEKGADKSAAMRRGQQRERTQLHSDISKAQSEITKLNEERAPIAKELRKVEAEVGPIKYIAALLYGDNPDQNILEKAVRWVIIIIVIVFDPLAVILLLASQYSFMWFRKEQDDEMRDEYDFSEAVRGPVIKEAEPEEKEEEVDRFAYLKKPWVWKIPGSESVGPLVYKAEEPKVEEPVVEEFTEDDYDNLNDVVTETDDEEIIEEALDSEKAAMRAWKHDHPGETVKHQRRLFETGAITVLPWEDYLKPQADFSDDDAAAEAAKWALEQLDKKQVDLDERPGDYVNPPSEVSYMENVDGHQVRKTLEGYQQNAEQGDNTLWKRIKKGDE